MNKKAIVFDFGGVLIDWNPRRLYRKMFTSETEMEWFLENICTSEWNLRIDCGKSFAESVKELAELHPQWEKEIKAFHLSWKEMLGGELPASVEILKELQSTGYKIYGLTNWSAETFPIAFERYDFLKTLDGIVVSGAEKLVKPDPALFKVLLDRYSLKPEACIFIDDNQHNTEAAESIGFISVHFTSPAQLREVLTEMELLQ